MPRTIDKDGNVTFVGKESVKLFRLIQLKHLLKLELKGIKVHRRSIYAQIKREFGLKGNKQKVYDQFVIIVDKAALKDPVVKEDE